ncbi:MAG: DUF58 domain-containing protein [Hymenobacter sp.]
MGVKRIRRVGHSMEFEQIRPYAAGDDPRTINWKASGPARRHRRGRHAGSATTFRTSAPSRCTASSTRAG